MSEANRPDGDCVLVLDIGKTNIKVQVLDSRLASLFERSKANHVIDAGPYPHFDVAAIWTWLLAAISDAAKIHNIVVISVTAHGAAAALVDRHKSGDGLVLPVLDYESDLPESCSAQYQKVRPEFQETLSPTLSGGLNLGRQLFWLQYEYAGEFQQATDILLYPQYWVWRLTGVACSEMTSLGCHTDLWNPQKRDYSSLVDAMAWRTRFAPIKLADAFVGTIKEEISQQTGLNPNSRVTAGIHDSNASYLRYARQYTGGKFAVISTGTWAITMASGASCENLKEQRDMLANVDYQGRPVACARFMAGREYAGICQALDVPLDASYGLDDIQKIVARGVYALPQFTSGSGPFAHRQGQFSGEASQVHGAALASVYLALMLDYELDLLEAEGDLFIEGAFLKNQWLCRILAALRNRQTVYLSRDTTGTARGAAVLAGIPVCQESRLEVCEPVLISELLLYQNFWRKALSSS